MSRVSSSRIGVNRGRRTVLEHEGGRLLDDIGNAPLHDRVLGVLERDEHGDADELGGHGVLLGGRGGGRWAVKPLAGDMRRLGLTRDSGRARCQAACCVSCVR